MLSRRFILTTRIWPPLASRTYKNVKVKRSQKSKNDSVKGNPGSNRLLALALDGESPESTDLSLDDIEDGENDMLDSHLFYDEHMKEIKKQKQFKSFQNIKRKYFKNNAVQPNFLTYLEKQQIKNLHAKSPKEWTPETLSSCFPASSEIICKILKSKWIADDGQKILRHDKLVQQNWESFRNGSLSDILSDELKTHLSRFSDRRPTLITLEQAEDFIPKLSTDYLKPEEFGQIITSYLGEPVKQKEPIKIESKEIQYTDYTVERIYENDIKTNTRKQHYTLDEFKNDAQKESFSWYTPQNLPASDKCVDVSTVEDSLRENTSIINRKEVSKFLDTMNNYPLAIRIPKQVWKKGYTYRVNDCFYDDTGDFIYRVPGLTTKEDRPPK